MSTSTLERYEGRVRRGTNRALTADEKAALLDVVSRWHDVPPPQNSTQENENSAVRAMLLDLFEDGVSLVSLANATNWNINRVAGILHRARHAGLGTGTRRYIAPTPKERDAFRRDLTADERRDLLAEYAALPRTAAGTARWRSNEAARLLMTLDHLNNDRVSLDDLGAALDMSRQAVHQHLARYRKTTDAADAVVAVK